MNKHYLCSTTELSDIQAKGITTTLPNEERLSLIIVKQQHNFYAYVNQCPHRDVKLEWDTDDFFDESGAFLRCSEHGALFLPKTGECIVGPCQYQSLEKVPIFVENNGVFCDLEALYDEPSL
jgi:nitrite reductase/ring-hydroxylating ferredoxin subunit